MARRRRRRKSDEAPGWVWMIFGLGIGLIVALGVYINTPSSDDLPAPAAARPADGPTEVPTIDARATQRESNDAQDAPIETPAQPAPAEDNEDFNRFSFYDELANFEVVIPEVETPQARAQEVAAIADPGIYILQAGSFLTQADADAQRARLALLGVESRIQRVSIDDRRFHRVRIGPIEDLDDLNSIRARLLGSGIDSMVMRLAQ